METYMGLGKWNRVLRNIIGPQRDDVTGEVEKTT
jgi:hypothetical protein